MSRHTITPYPRGSMWWARIPQVGKPSAQRSLGTTDQFKATEMCAFLVWLRGQRDGYLLGEIAKGSCPIGDAYDAWHANKLDAFVAEWKKGSEDANLEPYVAKWVTEMERINRPSAGSRKKYIQQVRSLIPEGSTYPQSQLTKVAIREWLSGYGKVSNKYRAALSSFAAYLVESDVLLFNPVSAVKSAKPSKPRERYLDQADAHRLVDALEGEARIWHALAMATGMETQGLARLKRRDVDLDAGTVFVRGTKNTRRTRTVYAYWRWEWAFALLRDYLKGASLLPDALVFTISGYEAYVALKDACTALGIEDYTTHDHRHTWAVQAVRDNLNIQLVSNQLGHSNAAVTLGVYARFIPNAGDFQRPATLTATVPNPDIASEGAK